MGRQEQEEEREVLDSIFQSEIQDISDTEYRISINLDSPLNDHTKSDPLQILLHVEYPPEYPDEAPKLDLLRPSNSVTHQFFNITTDKQYLLESTKETINENLGMAMIFTLIYNIKDNAEQLIVSRQREWLQEQDKKFMEDEREENKRFHGTPVTPETFASWRESFINEMKELKEKEEEQDELMGKKKPRAKAQKPPMTGKELWINGIAGKVDDGEHYYNEYVDVCES